MIIKRFDKKKGSLAISQIFILVVGIIAVSYAIGSGVGIVSGAEVPCNSETGPNCMPKVINEVVAFCYGNDTLGYHRYTVIEKDRIKDDRNFLYRSHIAGEEGWQYSSDGGNTWKEVVGQTLFDDLADKAITRYLSLPKLIPPTKSKGYCAEKYPAMIGGCCRINWKKLNYNNEEECITNEKKILIKILKEEKSAKEEGGGVAVNPTFPWPEADKEDAWQELDKPITFKQDGKKIVIEEIKKTDKGVFVKVDGKDIPMNEKDIIALQSLGVLNDDGTVNQAKIKTPEIATHFGIFEVAKGGFFDGILGGLAWAGAVFGGVQTIGRFLGVDVSLVNAASLALSAGTFVGKATVTWGLKGWGVLLGAGVAVGLFLVLYRKETQEIITFTCYPWDADTGGSDCDKCNKQGILPCSEYQCRSLGQACELLNKGTDEEKCAWVNRNDVEFPRIEAWEDALLSDDYEYEPDNTLSPPERGVIIEYTGEGAGSDKCVPAFTPLSFGIITSDKDGEKEPAKCKIDILRKDNFDDMDFYFGGSSLFKEEHTQIMSLPGSSALEAEDITIENEGEYEVYVRCQDANGNSNTANFVFKFCVEKGPDTTPPLIVETKILNGFPIAYNQTSIENEIYINEPADCRWSHSDQSYDTMEDDTVHQMDCSSSVFEMNAQMLYRCSTTLTGLKSRQENKFYFRCKDQPKGVAESDRNVNAESYKFSLIGTQPLVIDWVKPEEGSIIKDSTESVKVTLEAKTSAGYNEGKSNCYFSDTGDEDDYVLFLGDGNYEQYQHSQNLWLPEKEGGYKYFIKCCDLGNNCDNETANFEIDTDLDEPIVVRAYHEEIYLKLVTNEPARCVYDTRYENYPCDYSFDDGTSMTTIEDVNHYTEWNTQTTFYIICQDEYGNQPDKGCSKIIRPFEFY